MVGETFSARAGGAANETRSSADMTAQRRLMDIGVPRNIAFCCCWSMGQLVLIGKRAPIAVSSPRRRGPIATGLSYLSLLSHFIAKTRRMDPRLRGDDTGNVARRESDRVPKANRRRSTD